MMEASPSCRSSSYFSNSFHSDVEETKKVTDLEHYHDPDSDSDSSSGSYHDPDEKVARLDCQGSGCGDEEEQRSNHRTPPNRSNSSGLLQPATPRVIKAQNADRGGSGGSMAPGAYASGTRAFGERPAWQQTTEEARQDGVGSVDPLLEGSGGDGDDDDDDLHDDDESESIVAQTSTTGSIFLAPMMTDPRLRQGGRKQTSRRALLFSGGFLLLIVIALGVGIPLVTFVGSNDEQPSGMDFGQEYVISFCEGIGEQNFGMDHLSYLPQDAEKQCRVYSSRLNGAASKANFSIESDNCLAFLSVCLLDHGVENDTLLARFALSDFYFATGGPRWKNYSGWIDDDDICSWHGVGCSISRDVVEINLNQNSLRGSIPSTIGLLTYLTTLSVSRNNIDSQIPTELNLLTHLVAISVSSNRFSGTLPNLSSLQHLTFLDIGANNIKGELTQLLLNLRGHAPNIRSVRIENNVFSGTIPTEIGDLVKLQQLNIDMNQVVSTIPTEIGKLTALDQLHVGRNLVTGKLPSEVGQLTQLRMISFQSLRLTGTIPNSLFGLTKLEVIQGDNNEKLGGFIPTQIGLVTDLVRLGLNSNRLTGTLASELGLLTKLTQLDLTYNLLHGTVPRELTKLTNLVGYQLFLYNAGVVGPVDSSLCDVFRKIKFCNLEECSCCELAALGQCRDHVLD